MAMALWRRAMLGFATARGFPMRPQLPAFLFLATAAIAQAAPADYRIEGQRSSVGFATDFGANTITGSMPILRADLTLDFDRAANSHVEVTLSAARAEASFPFAAAAMKGATVLDVANWPTITFASTSVAERGDAATVTGNLTIRGVTRPVTFDARIFRQEGYAEGDRSHLTVRLTGRIARSDFGATGWADLVGDEVRLDIVARIARVD